MLGDANIGPTLPVSDLDEAREFYEETLGLTKESEDIGGIIYLSGSSRLFVYPSEYAGTNQATAAAWETDDVEGAVEELRGKGISFEHYNLPGATRQGDVHVMGETKGAWFKDPFGNILCVATK